MLQYLVLRGGRDGAASQRGASLFCALDRYLASVLKRLKLASAYWVPYAGVCPHAVSAIIRAVSGSGDAVEVARLLWG